VAPPPAGDVLVPFPSGLAWDSSTDTLWLLERNARRISNISLDGALLASFPHPRPPLQDGVYNYGLSIDAARGALYVSAAGPFDHRITKLVEVTRRGEVTGVEIQLDSDAYPRSEGFALAPDGCSVLVSSRAGNVSDLVLYRAFAPLPSVLDLRAERAAGGAHLRWTNAGEYHALEVYRGRDRAAVLPAGASEWLDPSPPSCGIFYRVVPLLDGQAGPGSLCEIPAERPFIRGDVEEDGRLTISDAIAILLYLFVGADAPACLDACDADDDGQINITDPVRLLNFLFLGSASPPPPPFPDPGCDPTEDDLTCGEEPQVKEQ
ncbi:MAG: hypothetical protein JXA90_04445, partial [Planctomycetes bacterium]|nr:hypothetical protein [Planctomycetota bacterium]